MTDTGMCVYSSKVLLFHSQRNLLSDNRSNMAKGTIGIIGTGDYARALAKRLLYSGHSVVCGSREPLGKNLAQIDPALRDVVISSIPDCIAKSDIVFLAIPAEVHQAVKHYADRLKDRIVVDISNPVSEDEVDSRNQSIAENLSEILPEAKVVKAFNTLSAYGLEVDGSITTGNRDVLVCGDDAEAKNIVMQLARDLGFTAVDYGGLKMAREQERIPILLFNGWGLATKVVLVMFPIWLALGYARYYVLKQPPFTLNRFPTNFLNKIMACMAVTLLAFCFLPGCFAAFNQIKNGTKYIRFSNWLDQWLKMRKQLGIYGLMFALVHIVLSVTIIQPAYFPDWFIISSIEVPVPDGTGSVKVPLSSIMNLKGECVVLFGVLALLLMGILGLTSVPAVGNLLNWREWVFVQSQIGVVCLIIAAIHITIKGASEWMVSKDWFEVVQRLSFQSTIIPYFTLILKLFLLLPPVSAYVWKIRRGWERKSAVKPKTS